MRRHLVPKLIASAAFLFTACAPAILRAQENPPPDDQSAQQPGPAVARLSVINGDINVLRGDSGNWVAAAMNAPVMAGDHVASGQGSRAEVQFDYSNLLRLGSNAEVQFARMDYGDIEVQVAHGTVTFRVLRNSQGKVAIDTPLVSVRPLSIGTYRIYVQPDGQTEVTLRAGSADIYTPQGTQPLQAGQTLLARGDPSNPEFRIVSAIAFDEWDRWNDQRDHELERSSSYQHVPQDVYGAEDLDQYGRWVDVPSYGQVWAPTVGPDWAPYQYGNWVWEGDYGWTWVSYDPWGWAPFHWGRWFYAAPFGWCWYPHLFGYHYWSPGLVAFFGFGGGGGVGFGFGRVGWVPLAPFERVHSWWGGHGFYGGVRGMHIENVNIANTYRNARVANGVGSVSTAEFQQGRFSNITRMNGSQIRQAGLVQGALPVTPSNANLRFTTRSPGNVPRASNVRFFSRNSSPAVQRTPFAEQQRAMQQFSRQPAAPAGSGWRSFGTPAAPANGWRPLNQPPARSVVVTPSPSSGWSRFGESRPLAPVARPQNSYTPPRSNSGYPSSSPGYRPQPAPRYPSYGSPGYSRASAPAPRPAPSGGSYRPSGGGGGSSRGSGGGGGGSHAGGGGGSHGGGGGASHGGGGHR